MILKDVDRYQVCDAVYESVRVVLSYRGEKYSPAYIQGISGSAFRIAGPCPCAPTCSGMMGSEDLIRLLGYQVEPMQLCGKGADPARDVGKVVARVKDEIRSGRPVVVWHAFTNAEWDVVCGFDEEKGEFLGRGSYAGMEEYARAEETRTAKCDICPSLGAIFIGRKKGAFKAREAELAALEEAVRFARTPRDRFLDEAADGPLPWRFREGLASYDAWVRGFQSDPSRVPGVGDRYPAGIYRSTHRAAAGFLRELAPKYPEAKAFLEEGARHFDADADALDELVGKLFGGWKGWQQPDPEKSARAAALLKRARDQYALGIESIEYALQIIDPARVARASLPARVRRGRGKAEVRNVPRLAWEQGKECTYVGALEAALKNTRHPYGYSDLMGLSGLAFRVRWCNDETKTKWCHSCAVGEMPDEGNALQRLSGWSLPGEWVERAGRDNAALRKRVVAAIDAGEPVLTYPASYDMALIYGYEEGGKTLLLRDYSTADETLRLPVEKLEPLRIYVGTYAGAPPLPQALRSALGMGVRNWRRERHDGGLPDREYWYGDAALAAWVRDVRRFDALPEETRKGLPGLCGWCYAALRDARRAAVGFLKDWSCVAGGDAGGALKKAAEIYEAEGKALQPVDWSTPEGRAKGIEVLAEAQRLEREAIAQLEAALKCKELGEAGVQAPVSNAHPPVLLGEAIRAIDNLPADGRFFNNRHTYLVYRAALLQAAGVCDVDYETLVAVAGYGSSFGYHPKRSFLDSPPDGPREQEQRLAQATGRAWEWLDRAKTPDEAWEKIRASVDAGAPVQGSWLDPYIFAGYQDAGRKEDRRVFVMGGWERPGWWDCERFSNWYAEWGQMSRLGGEVERTPSRDVALGVLNGIVRHSRHDGRATTDFRGLSKGKYGLAGIEAYAADIADPARKADDWDAGWRGCHCAYRQITGRRCLAAYLRRVAGELPEAARPHVQAAAAEYEAAWADWCRWGEQLGQDSGPTQTEAQQKLWEDPARRAAGAAAIRDALAHERAAAAEAALAVARW